LRENGIVVNDFVIPTGDETLDGENTGRHFCIQALNGLFTVQDLNNGYGTYYRVNEPVILESNDLINMGESTFLVPIISTRTGDIKIKVRGGKSDGKEFVSAPTKVKYTIGRITG
jgi:hypothetical protein